MIFADREAIVHGADRLTFREAWLRGCRVANGLRALGMYPGDRIATLEDNSKEAVDIFLGAAIANLVRVPLYARDSHEAHVHKMGHTDCKALIASAAYAEEAGRAAADVPSVEQVLIRDDRYEAWLACQSSDDPNLEVQPYDLYIIRHTGGTTGNSKAVAYTHWKWLAVVRDWFYCIPRVLAGDACIHVGPISHASGYCFIPIWLGGGVNVMVDKFDPEHVLDLMEHERAAFVLAVPTILNALNQCPSMSRRDWSSLKCMMIVSAPITDSTALQGRANFGDVLYQGFGLTEAPAVAWMNPQQWFSKVEGSEPLRACGIVAPFAMMEVWDDNNKPLPVGEAGQLVIRADGQMTGYWKDPEATAQRLVDGWVLTADIGMIDRNGYVYLLDRANDTIISGGFNIFPSELENVIAAHPDVFEVAVFGIPHTQWGETPCAVVVPKAGRSLREDDIVKLCALQLGSYKKPGRVVFQDQPLPKTPVGKVLRKELREPFWQGHTRRVGGS